MVERCTVRAVPLSSVWVAWTHAAHKTGEGWLDTSKTLTLLLSR